MDRESLIRDLTSIAQKVREIEEIEGITAKGKKETATYQKFEFGERLIVEVDSKADLCETTDHHRQVTGVEVSDEKLFVVAQGTKRIHSTTGYMFKEIQAVRIYKEFVRWEN